MRLIPNARSAPHQAAATAQSEPQQQAAPIAAIGGGTSPQTQPVWDVPTLMAGGREAVILFSGREYRLRITSNNKLIMTA
jgi:hemin uptake protein HemP